MSVRLPLLPTVKDILKLYRLNAVKQMSQNFLLDNNVLTKIVKYCGKLRNAEVLEVGPGPGSITRMLMLKNPERIIVVEKDKRFKPTLDMLADAFSMSNGKMDIIYDDIRNIRLEHVFSTNRTKHWEDRCPDIHIVGNLPFSISTNLIIRWLHDIAEKRGAWSFGRVKMTLTFQKEVAERLVAPPSGIQRCRLSTMAQAWTRPELQFIIPGKKFVPKPDVDVGVVTFTPLIKPLTNHEFKYFEKINRYMFSFRQKYNYKCAGNFFPPEVRKDMALKMFEMADCNPYLRAYELTVDNIDRLGYAYKELLELYPEFKLYDYRSSKKVCGKAHSHNVTVEELSEEEDIDYNINENSDYSIGELV